MKLKEFEGKVLFRKSGLSVPEGRVVSSADDIPDMPFCAVKVQTLSGGRGKKGGVRFCSSRQQAVEAVTELLGSRFGKEIVEEVLVEEKIDSDSEFYVGFLFDTRKRRPVLILSTEGGVDIEETKDNDPEKVLIRGIDVLEGIPAWQARQWCEEAGFSGKDIIKVGSAVCRLYECFRMNDMRMMEVNPLMKDKEGKLMAADAVVVLDDDALKRHDFSFPERTGFREKTEREVRANDIDREDYRGVAGRTFIDIGGDIATLSSGGGASITAMDALLTYGATLSNYTEYSGNPPPQKVEKLARVVLKPGNLAGCFIVGGRANFTRIDLTLEAILKVLIEKKARYPIVVRRAGPGDREAFEMFRAAAEKHNLDVHLYDDTTPISLAAKKMAELAKGYKEKQGTKDKKWGVAGKVAGPPGGGS